ncbi:MAG: copper resistance protein CopC [Actinomycetia bacterium]|nr:copper resistance protein CopC [Actinomycetes bacterium]
MRATQICAAAAVALLAVVVCAGPASAHTSLQNASPGIGSTAGPPNLVVLTYADPVRLTQVLISDTAGRHYQSGPSFAVDNTVTERIASTLPNGLYTVAWRVVSPDGHPVEGTYQFTVAGSTAAALAPVQAAGQTNTPAGTSVWWIGLVVLLVVGVGAGVVVVRRGLKADADAGG